MKWKLGERRRGRVKGREGGSVGIEGGGDVRERKRRGVEELDDGSGDGEENDKREGYSWIEHKLGRSSKSNEKERREVEKRR
jgi:hypothetical protein